MHRLQYLDDLVGVTSVEIVDVEDDALYGEGTVRVGNRPIGGRDLVLGGLDLAIQPLDLRSRFALVLLRRQGVVAFAGGLELAERLRVEADCLIVPGEHFDMPNYVRLGFGPHPERLLEALDRCATVIDPIRTAS